MQKRNLLLIFLALAILIGLAAIAFAVVMVRHSITSIVEPLQNANKQLGTQVSQLLHPTPTILPDPVTIINEVQALARLETIRYTVEKVITAETGQGVLAGLFGDRLIFVAHGYVIAGFDMSKMKSADMWLEGNVLNIRLPQAEVLVSALDGEKSYVYDRQTGLLTKGDPTLETQARQVAEQELQQSALDDGILDQAFSNGQQYLNWFFGNLGYKQVHFVPPSH